MSGSTLAKLAIAFVWATLLALVIAIGLEVYLKVKWVKRREVNQVGLERYDRLLRSYHPFAIQHINPNYLFFFPFEPEDRIALSNEYVTLDSAGFRGQGPEYAGNRELAFLLGGSTAFSFSSSDSTTITGYLNRLQDRYHFVNAGVPSWNSTQEIFRLVNQILAYEPDLVVTFDGANDMAVVVRYNELGMEFPPGTPESFGQLQALVGDIRARSRKGDGGGLIRRFFPNLSESIAARLDPPTKPGPIPRLLIQQTAAKYVFNLTLMSELTEARGARFVSFFQPIIWLHENGPEEQKSFEYASDYRYYHDLVFEDTTASYQRVDLSDMFDFHFDDIPYFEPEAGIDLADSAVFIDPVHFFDLGNRMIAEQIIGSL